MDMVPTLPGRLTSIAVGPYAELVKPLLQKPLTPTKRFVDDSKVSDHHAIIPTGEPLRLAVLNADELKLYDLIARRFIAVLYPAYRYDQTTVITEVNRESFESRGKAVKDEGWRAVAGPTAEKGDAKDETLPEQVLVLPKKGEVKPVKELKINKGKTKPPARYTEATLLTAMESPGKFIEDEELRETIKQGGLGTPATRAEIIEKLLHNNYVERHGKELVPTSKGVQLINLVSPALKSPELTALWEQRLADIARGKGDRKEFLADIRASAAELVKTVAADTTVYRADNISRTKCPVCGKFMLLVKGKRGRMLVCQDRACGHRQPEKQDETGAFRSSRKASAANQRLIARYSDKGPIGQSLGDLLKAAIEEKEKAGEGE
jgi:DNA topoisomerase-3